MLVEKEKIKKAKEKLGIKSAEIIAEILNIQDYDPKNMKGLCPFHAEDTPSFIFNPKSYSFHCFGCGKNVDLIDAYIHSGHTYIEAVQYLFELAKIKYSFGEVGVQTQHSYRYPKPEYDDSTDAVYDYLEKRHISRETADYLGIRQDKHKNLLFQYYDLNDVLTMVKVRPSRKVNKGEPKTWCLPNYDTTPLLFNLNKINTDSPLLITSGELDCAAAIEAGFTNACSIPLGDQNTQWVNECWDFLEQFDEIIIAYDNDESGQKFVKEIVPRLGSWRCKIVNIPEIVEIEGERIFIKDLNECLYYLGKEALLNYITHAEDTPVPSVVDFSVIEDQDFSDIDGVNFGIEELDKHLMRLFYGSFTVVSGTPGCVDCDTEFFDGTQWKRIADYEDGDCVLQYNENSDVATLVKPMSYIKQPCESMYGFNDPRGTSQMLSDEHRVLYYDAKNNPRVDFWGNIRRIHEASKYGFTGKFKSTFRYSGTGMDLTDGEIKLMCAVICDGTFYQNAQPHQRSYHTCRFHIKKDRKKDRLREIFQECNLPWREHESAADGYTDFYVQAPRREKVFGADWYQCSNHQLEVICENILFWDRNWTSTSHVFSTSCKQTADFIQFAFSAYGNRASISERDRRGQMHSSSIYQYQSKEYTVIINQKQFSSLTRRAPKRKVPLFHKKTKDGYKYCFEVPTGTLVLRKDNKIFITKNSGKTSFLYQLICNAIDESKPVWLFSRELPEWMSKNWLLFLLSGQRYLNEYQNNKGSTYYKVRRNIKTEINEHYKDLLMIYRDDYPNDIESLKSSMTDSARKYGCKLFVIDNMTTVDLQANENNKYEKQTEFVNWLIQFSMRFDVATVLVNHPRKMQTELGEQVGMYDLSGTSNIANLAHRAIGLRRVKPKEKKGVPGYNGDWKTPPCPYDVVVNVIKDRLQGYANFECGLFYDKKSRRFFSNYEEFDKQYSWDHRLYDDVLPCPALDEIKEIVGEVDEP